MIGNTAVRAGKMERKHLFMQKTQVESQHPYNGSQPSITPVPRGSGILFQTSKAPGMHVLHIHVHRGNTYKIKFKNLKKF